MRISLTVGDVEKHVVDFSFNQLLGRVRLSIDTQVVKQSQRWFNEPISEVHETEVGHIERTRVRIEKERLVLFTSRYRVFVNSRLVDVVKGS
jgi:hypothetical protein